MKLETLYDDSKEITGYVLIPENEKDIKFLREDLIIKTHSGILKKIGKSIYIT